MIALAQHAPASVRALPSPRFDMPTVQEDIAYYRRWLTDCTEQATRAIYCSSRCVHEELAKLHGERLAALGARPPVSDTFDLIPAVVSRRRQH